MRKRLLLVMCSSALCFADRAAVTDHRVLVSDAKLEFDLPDGWPLEPGETVHVSDVDLTKIEKAGGEWDREFAAVVNTALPFNRCVGYFGQEGWGDRGRSFSDLQFRVYFVAGRDMVFDDAIEKAVSVARRCSKEATIEKNTDHDW